MDGCHARRLAGTLGLVLAIDVLLAVSVAVVLEPWLSIVLSNVGVTSTGATIVVLTALVGGVLVVGQLRYTRRELLAETNATVIEEPDDTSLTDRVRRLATQVDMPTPAVAIADSPVENSLAIGDLGAGTVVVSRGLIERLDGPELDAVLAHELVHLKNRDALVLTIASFVPALVADDYSLLEDVPAVVRNALWIGGLLGGYLLASTFLDAPVGSPASVGQFLVAVALTIVVGGIVVGVLAAGVLVAARSLSRHREFIADRDGARIAGSPAAMANALATLDGRERRPTTDSRVAAKGLWLLPHGFGTEPDPDDGSFTVQTRSHPPTDERIARLRDLTAALERAA